ncbi:MAG: 2-methylaconitate cis-trans isomerase PrpF [Pseudomonadota bacterium]
MSHPAQIGIPATYMRGGTSKGVFFCLNDLPKDAQIPGDARDRLLLRVIGSPDAYAKHTDGMGGATSSTSKTVILSKSEQSGHDVDYLFGQVAIDRPFVDWSGNCGNLTAAVGSFAISNGLLDATKIPENGVAEVRIWQVNTQKSIVAHVPMTNGVVQETGDFELDGVTFPAAEVKVEFLKPAPADQAMFPTGNLQDQLDVPGVGTFNTTMINAGIPTIFLDADELGFDGTELQSDINSNPDILAKFETIRAHGAVAMGLISDVYEAQARQHTPKVAFVAPAKSFQASSGKQINAPDIDLNVRALSMGFLHHAMMGTAAVAISIAAAVPGTLVNLAAGGGERNSVRFGHPSGTLKVGGHANFENNAWQAQAAIMSRSARVLMKGSVYVPADY